MDNIATLLSILLLRTCSIFAGPSRQIARITVYPVRGTNKSSQLEFPAANPHKVYHVIRKSRERSVPRLYSILFYFLSLTLTLTLILSHSIIFFQI